MGGLCANEAPPRLLCLGNEILADDAFGLRVAERLNHPALDVVCSSAGGFHLLDDVLGAQRLIVVDTVLTGDVPPGTIRILEEDQVRSPQGGSPHATGLFDVLRKGREIGLPVPRRVTIVAVEAADCTTVGGPMHPAVKAAIEPVVQIVRGLCNA